MRAPHQIKYWTDLSIIYIQNSTKRMIHKTRWLYINFWTRYWQVLLTQIKWKLHFCLWTIWIANTNHVQELISWLLDLWFVFLVHFGEKLRGVRIYTLARGALSLFSHFALSKNASARCSKEATLKLRCFWKVQEVEQGGRHWESFTYGRLTPTRKNRRKERD